MAPEDTAPSKPSHWLVSSPPHLSYKGPKVGKVSLLSTVTSRSPTDSYILLCSNTFYPLLNSFVRWLRAATCTHLKNFLVHFPFNLSPGLLFSEIKIHQRGFFTYPWPFNFQIVPSHSLDFMSSSNYNFSIISFANISFANHHLRYNSSSFHFVSWCHHSVDPTVI